MRSRKRLVKLKDVRDSAVTRLYHQEELWTVNMEADCADLGSEQDCILAMRYSMLILWAAHGVRDQVAASCFR